MSKEYMNLSPQMMGIGCWWTAFGRGVLENYAQIDEWLKDVAPSQNLRKWFGHQPEKWELFRKRYSAELQTSTSFALLKALISKYKTLILIYSARDKQHNHAIVLQGLLQPPNS